MVESMLYFIYRIMHRVRNSEVKGLIRKGQMPKVTPLEAL